MIRWGGKPTAPQAGTGQLFGPFRSGFFKETGFIHPTSHCFAPFPKRSDMLFWGQKSMQKTLWLLMIL